MKRSTLALAITAAALSQAASADFLGDSKATLDMRNLYFNEDVRDRDIPSTQEWGQGFILNYQSGFTEGTVGLGIDAIGLLGYASMAVAGRARQVLIVTLAPCSRWIAMVLRSVTIARPV